MTIGITLGNVIGKIPQKDWLSLGKLRKDIKELAKIKKPSKVDKAILKKKEHQYDYVLGKYLPKPSPIIKGFFDA